jgi:hypothetical protein
LGGGRPAAHHRRVLRARLPFPALDAFDNVAIGIFDHSNGGPGPDGRFGPRAGDVRGFPPLDHLVQIGDDKGQVAQVELLVDADGARAWRSCTPGLRIMFGDLSRPVCTVSISRLSALEICFQPLVHLLSAPLMIPLACYHINRFRRASSGDEAMAGRQKEERRAGIASHGIVRRLGRFSSGVRHRGVPARGMVPDRCTSSESSVGLCSDASA